MIKFADAKCYRHIFVGTKKEQISLNIFVYTLLYTFPLQCLTGYEDKCMLRLILRLFMQGLSLFPLSYTTGFSILYEAEWQHNGSSHFC